MGRALLGACVLNSYDFEPSDTEALFEIGARIEHSCVPNVVFVVERRSAAGMDQQYCGVWRAKRDIAMDSAVSVSYLNASEIQLRRAGRWKLLMKRHGFACACTRCKQELLPRELSSEPMPVGECQHSAALVPPCRPGPRLDWAKRDEFHWRLRMFQVGSLADVALELSESRLLLRPTCAGAWTALDVDLVAQLDGIVDVSASRAKFVKASQSSGPHLTVDLFLQPLPLASPA